MTSCRHQWLDLYQQPNSESGFIQVYEAQKLDSFKKCGVCGAIGKRNERGTILQLPQAKGDKHLLDAARWFENLKAFAVVQEEECSSTY